MLIPIHTTCQHTHHHSPSHKSHFTSKQTHFLFRRSFLGGVRFYAQTSCVKSHLFSAWILFSDVTDELTSMKAVSPLLIIQFPMLSDSSRPAAASLHPQPDSAVNLIYTPVPSGLLLLLQVCRWCDARKQRLARVRLRYYGGLELRFVFQELTDHIPACKRSKCGVQERGSDSDQEASLAAGLQ